MLCLVSVPLNGIAASKIAANPVDGLRSYIVILSDPPLAAYDGRALPGIDPGEDSIRLNATSNVFTGAKKLNVESSVSRRYLQLLDSRFDRFTVRAGHHR